MSELAFECECEEICWRYVQLTSVATAIEDAMMYSPNADKAYYAAQSLLSTLLYDNTNELKRLVHDEFE